MFDPASITLGQVSSALRDLTVIGFLLTISWKSRGVYEAAKNFFERLTTHMQIMEQGMSTLLNNHLAHIETDLRSMTQHQVRATAAEQADYVELANYEEKNVSEI